MLTEFHRFCDAVESGEIELADATDDELERIIALAKRVQAEEAEREQR